MCGPRWPTAGRRTSKSSCTSSSVCRESTVTPASCPMWANWLFYVQYTGITTFSTDSTSRLPFLTAVRLVLRSNESWFTWAEIRLCSCWRSWCVNSTWLIPLAQQSHTWTTHPTTALPPVTRSPQSPQVGTTWRLLRHPGWVFAQRDGSCLAFVLTGTTSSSNTMVPGSDGHHDSKMKDSNMEDRYKQKRC